MGPNLENYPYKEPGFLNQVPIFVPSTVGFFFFFYTGAVLYWGPKNDYPYKEP